MEISAQGIALIKKFEGCKLTAYPDPGTGGDPWTIGYGWTQPVDGKKVVRGMTISQATADRLLKCGVVQYEQAVNRLVKVHITQGEFDALVSFAYNVGVKALSTSTLLKKLNTGDRRGAADEFLNWTKAGGIQLSGLFTRRKSEREMFLNGSVVLDAIAATITSGLGAISAT